MGKGSGRRPPVISGAEFADNWNRAFLKGTPLPNRDGVTCRGSRALGTACGRCERCADGDEAGQIIVDYDEYRRLQLESQDRAVLLEYALARGYDDRFLPSRTPQKGA